jgi:hypothetical protein
MWEEIMKNTKDKWMDRGGVTISFYNKLGEKIKWFSSTSTEPYFYDKLCKRARKEFVEKLWIK